MTGLNDVMEENRMGSGYSGMYHGTHGSSQRYASSYKVCKDMKKYDISRGICSEKDVYIKNPTAKNIKSMINGNYIGNKNTNGIFVYAITTKGDIIVGKRNGNGKDGLATPHPTLIGGKNPKVKMAGMLEIAGGKIKSFNNESGHFKPNKKSMPTAKKIFEELGKNLFHKEYNWDVKK